MTNDVASTKLFRNSESKEEQRLLSVSDFSLYTNPCAAAYMKKKYPKHACKIDWIPTSDFEKDEQASELEVDINCIGYFGDYRQMYRNIYPFYEACIENNISAIIVGDGDTQLLSQNNVKVHPRMSRNELEAYEKKCGILVVLENFTKTGECIQVPGKLYHYGLTHKHILVITESSNISKDYEEYKSFVLRNSGNDCMWTRLQDGFQSRLMDLCGSTVAHQAWKPYAVYLNGQYWGHMNLRERVDEYMVAQFEGLDLEDTAVVVAPLVPWSIAGAVPLGAVGAPGVSVLLACYLYLLPIWNYAVEIRKHCHANK